MSLMTFAEEKKVRAYAKERAEYLAGAYDIDADTREAFVYDVVNELVAVYRSFLTAVDEVQAARSAGLAGEAVNRRARRKLQSQFRRYANK